MYVHKCFIQHTFVWIMYICKTRILILFFSHFDVVFYVNLTIQRQLQKYKITVDIPMYVFYMCMCVCFLVMHSKIS